ncbi:MAG TPA: GAF domain-containing protein, partial [Anaerolineae bacterium]|nr:GAF domain-containing protein [Anaerolineae bacterium]
MSKLPTSKAKHNKGLTPKYARQLAVMHEINQIIGSDEKVEVVIESALHHMLCRLDYQAIQIYRLSPSGKELWLYLEIGSTSDASQFSDIFSIEEENIIGHTIRQGEPIYLPDVRKGPYSSYTPAKSETAIKSELAVPLKYGQNLLGVLRFQSSRLDDFDEIDLTFLGSLAGLLASALKNSQTVQQLQDDLQEMKILYNLQRQEDLSQQAQAAGKRSTLGYQYNRTVIAEADDLSPSAQQALAKEQVGVSTIQEATGGKELIMPIKLYGETIGVIGVEEALGGQEWLTDDISLL